MSASIGLGIIVGLLGGINLHVLLTCIGARLASGASYPAREMGTMLGLVVFVGGGTWARGKLIPFDDLVAHGGLYLMIVAVFMLAFAAQPVFLMSRLANKIIVQKRRRRRR